MCDDYAVAAIVGDTMVVQGNCNNRAEVGRLALLLVLATVIGVSAKPAVAENVHGMLPRAGEPTRDGFAIGFALGAAGMVAGGGTDLSGVGGSSSLRVGTSAGERLLWMLQLDAAAYLFRIAGEELGVNRFAALSLAGQYYLKSALWMKLGVGVVTVQQEVRNMVALEPKETFRGPAALAALGLEFLQRGSLAVGIEAQITVSKIDPTALVEGKLALAAHYY